MKLATLRAGARDGQLVVVSRDLSRCLSVMPIEPAQFDRIIEKGGGLK